MSSVQLKSMQDLAQRRKDHQREMMEIAKLNHQRSGAQEPFDPAKHFTQKDLAYTAEQEAHPFTAWARQAARGGRLAGATAHQKLIDWANSAFGGKGPSAAGTFDKDVRDRWLGGGNAKDVFNIYSPAYQKLWGAVDAANGRDNTDGRYDRTLMPMDNSGPGSTEVVLHDAAGRPYKQTVPMADENYAMHNGVYTHKSLIPSKVNRAVPRDEDYTRQLAIG
jgi:hypothetical protein